jgi:aromatic ring hydroxylase
MKTGEQYIESLSDERQTYIDGRQIKDLTDDPTTRAAVALVASVYDKFPAELVSRTCNCGRANRS